MAELGSWEEDISVNDYLDYNLHYWIGLNDIDREGKMSKVKNLEVDEYDTCLKEHTFGTMIKESPDIQTGWMTPLARNQMAMEIVSSKMAGKNHMAIT